MLYKFMSLLSNIHRIPRFLLDYVRFKSNANGWECKFSDLLPIFGDRTTSMGFDAHYVYHTAWAARILKHLGPTEHVDISSSIMFCGVASAFVPIKHYDYRTPHLELENLTCGSQDLMRLTFSDNSIKSLSCMHVIEHIGLGRYGDPLNSIGDELAAKELTRVLAPGGNLLIVVPVAEKASIRFNGHRIYSLTKVKKLFEELDLIEMSFLNDRQSNKFTRHATEVDVHGSDYGCGCFLFRKPPQK